MELMIVVPVKDLKRERQEKCVFHRRPWVESKKIILRANLSLENI